MNIIKIPKKKKGEFREICVPSNEEKSTFRLHMASLNSKVKTLCDSDVVHGFSQQKSPVTNASKHIGKRFTLKFDLSNFFDTIKPSHLKGKIKETDLAILMPDNRAYQGLPTSPAIANLAAIELDSAITKKIKDKEIVYTRYADDLCFSFDDYSNVNFLKTIIPQIVGRCGFILNKNKTWLQDSKFGNRIITGVSVTNEGIKATRKVKRKLRAAIHQKNSKSIHGLKEWSKVKLPKEKKEELAPKVCEKDFKELLKLWKLKNLDVKDIPEKGETEIFDNGVKISSDPVQILGLSNFTTNWKSCMMHPSGIYHTGALLWLFLQGTKIAGLYSEETMTVCGFTRNKFKARTLIHELRNNERYYDRVYGESETSTNILKKELEANGIKHISLAPKEMKVKGNVICSKIAGKPYMDNLSAIKARYDGIPCYVFRRK